MAPSEKKPATDNAGACWDCSDDPGGKLKQMFVDIVQRKRIGRGQSPALRPVFHKVHGVVHGSFEPRADLPAELRVGVFALETRPAWVRFSSDTQPTAADLNSTCGVGIKLFDVPGAKLLGDGSTQDFILQNHDVFFVNTAQDMCEFTRAQVVTETFAQYLQEHPDTKLILDAMKKAVPSLLTAAYWSVLPYAFGEGRYVKYKLEPEQLPEGTPPLDDTHYLAADLAHRLRAGDVRFRFMVQFQTDEAAMPLDRATVRWSEESSPPIHVATLILPRQDLARPGQASYGEHLAFNPWHSLPEHAPQGSLSAARKTAYAASAAERRHANGVPSREPAAVRPAVALPTDEDTCIVKAAIHPCIGVARVGNSEEEFFYGPEVTDPLPAPPGFYRDGTGALKRQAARFRVYGLNARDQIVAELNAENAEVKWTVHLANKKAAWYQFQLALDIPEAASAPPSLLRNAAVADRSQLTIDPGPRSIQGVNQQGAQEHVFDTGRFMGVSVYLGELRTDAAGHLVVLGGRGRAASPEGVKAVTFANNEGWYDDISDGPVTAEVVYQGQQLKVDPAWVVTAPPNYAPMQKSPRTMWDLIRDVAITAKTLPKPARPSFVSDILPIFERMSRLQWVNAGFAAAFGWNSPNDFMQPIWLARLSDHTPRTKELRRTLANHLRVFERDASSPTPWPWLYGDAMSIPPADTPRQHLALTATQLGFLRQWVDNDFEADYDPERPLPRAIEEVPVAEQGAMLDKASLESCLADAFHPGCEMTWVMRSPKLYMAPFRILHAPANWKEPHYGAGLIQDILDLPSGPLRGQVPGGLTRWMALPWQTDTASCRSGYLSSYDPYLPTFWPARVPNQVLTAEDYDIVVDATRPLAERLAAFANRASWMRTLGTASYTNQINRMASNFGDMGVVEVRPGLEGSMHFPPEMQVEQLAPPRVEGEARLADGLADGRAAGLAPETETEEGLEGIEKVRRFPHGLRH